MILGSKQLNWSIPYSLNFTKWVEYRSGVYVIYRIAYLNYHEAIYIGITENRSLGERIYDHTMPSDEVQMYRDDILLVKYAPIYWEYERVFVESYLANDIKTSDSYKGVGSSNSRKSSTRIYRYRINPPTA